MSTKKRQKRENRYFSSGEIKKKMETEKRETVIQKLRELFGERVDESEGSRSVHGKYFCFILFGKSLFVTLHYKNQGWTIAPIFR